jgi:hypothetical protein
VNTFLFRLCSFPDNAISVSPENINVHTDVAAMENMSNRSRRDVMSNHVLSHWGGDNDNLEKH